MSASVDRDIVQTAAELPTGAMPPLLVLDRIGAFLDREGLGSGELVARSIGEGRSNFTFLVERDGRRFVLRRPPRPPYPPSTHDVVREARLLVALVEQGARVPTVLAICEDVDVLGVPFYVMEFVDGHVITTALPPPLDADEAARRRLGEDFVGMLAEIHSVDVSTGSIAAFVRPGSYLERQVE